MLFYRTPYQVGRSVKVGDRLPMSFTDVDVGDFSEADVQDIVSESELPDYEDDYAEGEIEE